MNHSKRQRPALQKGDLPLRVHGLMGEIQRDKASGQREVLQQAERRAHKRRRVRARADCLGGFQMQNAGRLS